MQMVLKKSLFNAFLNLKQGFYWLFAAIKLFF